MLCPSETDATGPRGMEWCVVAVGGTFADMIWMLDMGATLCIYTHCIRGVELAMMLWSINLLNTPKMDQYIRV